MAENSLLSLVESGTKLWLDSIDPDLVTASIELGATGATSNPIIIADLIRTGRFDDHIQAHVNKGLSAEEIAWELTDHLVRSAQDQFLETWKSTNGNDGYVSFELDPLIEDPQANLPHDDRVNAYIELGKKWSAGHQNRMIKVPATGAGIDALEAMAAAGIPLNVTLIFSLRQYQQARDAIWRGAQQRNNGLDQFKSVYSIFVSRIDVYTDNHCQLSDTAQGQVGIVNAKRIWQANQQFWKNHTCPLDQEIVFASTGTKKPEDKVWKYVQSLAGSDIQTNPPKTNELAAQSGVVFDRQVDRLPSKHVLDEIDSHVDFEHMESTLMSEGIAKFADPQKALIELLESKRHSIASVS
jgi:transaldolase